VIGGLILAAGGGHRFGAVKQLADLDGRPLLEHAIVAMEAVPAIERIVVVLGAAAGEISDQVDLGAAEVVVCRDWEEGLSASLRTGAKQLADTEAIIVTLGDQPLISREVIAAILDQIRAPEAAARATYDGRPGHPVLIKRELYGAVAGLRGDTGARDMLATAGVREFEAAHLCRPDDVDTPADLWAIRALDRGEVR